MRRTSEWWARLLPEERSILVWLEKLDARGGSSGSSYLPDDCSECNGCGNPQMGSGLCVRCLERIEELRAKGDAND